MILKVVVMVLGILMGGAVLLVSLCICVAAQKSRWLKSDREKYPEFYRMVDEMKHTIRDASIGWGFLT